MRAGLLLCLATVAVVKCNSARIIFSDESNLAFNLAFEAYLLKDTAVLAPILFLYHTLPVVVIGRHQNAWREVNMSALEADGVALVRRHSGGGAVYLDGGVLIFSIIAPRSTFSVDINFSIIAKALKDLGVDAHRSGRNDVTVKIDDRTLKVSGSAFQHAHDANGNAVSMHHGTLLLDANMDHLGRYLTPHSLKLASKGIKSVSSRVINLRQHPHVSDSSYAAVSAALAAAFSAEFAIAETVERVDKSTAVAAEQAFVARMAELTSWAWVLGKTPDFSHTLETRIDDFGLFTLHLDVQGGIIRAAKVFSDALLVDAVEALQALLTSVPYNADSILSALDARAHALLAQSKAECAAIGSTSDDATTHQQEERLLEKIKAWLALEISSAGHSPESG